MPSEIEKVVADRRVSYSDTSDVEARLRGVDASWYPLLGHPAACRWYTEKGAVNVFFAQGAELPEHCSEGWNTFQRTLD